MDVNATLTTYDYRVVGAYTIFQNQVPHGPVSMLHCAERIKVTYWDYGNKVRCTFRGFQPAGIRIAYFVAPGSVEFWQLFHLMPVFNEVGQGVTIFCSADSIEALKPYCNASIDMVDIAGSEAGSSIDVDCVVANSPAAIYFIRQRVPVLIAGARGFGGWVTGENFSYLSANGFSGRPGGREWEEIPPMIFLHELQAIRDSMDRIAIMDQLVELTDGSSFIPFSELDGMIGSIASQASKIHLKPDRWKLTPSLASNISIIRQQNKIYLKRKVLNDTLAVVEDTEFFGAVNGQHTFAELYKVSGCDGETSFWEQMHSLIEHGIIIY